MAHNMEKTMKDTYQSTKDAAKNIKADAQNVAAKIQDEAPEFGERIWGAVNDIKGQLAKGVEGGRAYVGQGEDLVKKYPVTAVLGAAAVGLVLGGIFFRRPARD